MAYECNFKSSNVEIGGPIELFSFFCLKCPRIRIVFRVIKYSMFPIFRYVLLTWKNILKKSSPFNQQIHCLNFLYYEITNIFEVFLFYNDIQIWSWVLKISLWNKKHCDFINFWGISVYKRLFFSSEDETKYCVCLLYKRW